MDNLLKELKTFESWNFTSNVEMLEQYKSKNLFKNAVIKNKVVKISCMANDLLIDNNGGVIWENVELLKTQGYSVFPKEQDRFGWLIGCIKCSKGSITFG